MAIGIGEPMSWHPTYKTPTREEAFLRPRGEENDGNWPGDLSVSGTSFGTRGNASKFRRQPKNHIEENVRRMRRIQKECRQKAHEKEISTPIPVKALWKSEKYAEVPSKLASELQKPELVPQKTYSAMTLHHNFNEQPVQRPHTADYLRAHSRTGIPPATPARPTASARSAQGNAVDSERQSANVDKPPLKRSSSCNNLYLLRNSADFIRINGIVARRTPLRRSPSTASLDATMHQKEEAHEKWKRKTMGSVPTYLVKLKEEKEQAERERLLSMPDPDQPPGHRLMPSAEQQQTLDLLRKSHRELQSKLAALPVRSDTLRLQRAKEELESRLAEVEEGIKIFSRPKVFVKVE